MADVELTYSVAGGGSLSGESGRLIATQLSRITSKIEDSKITKLKFKVDEASVNAIKKELSSQFKNFDVPIKVKKDLFTEKDYLNTEVSNAKQQLTKFSKEFSLTKNLKSQFKELDQLQTNYNTKQTQKNKRALLDQITLVRNLINEEKAKQKAVESSAAAEAAAVKKSADQRLKLEKSYNKEIENLRKKEAQTGLKAKNESDLLQKAKEAKLSYEKDPTIASYVAYKKTIEAIRQANAELDILATKNKKTASDAKDLEKSYDSVADKLLLLKNGGNAEEIGNALNKAKRAKEEYDKNPTSENFETFKKEVGVLTDLAQKHKELSIEMRAHNRESSSLQKAEKDLTGYFSSVSSQLIKNTELFEKYKNLLSRIQNGSISGEQAKREIDEFKKSCSNAGIEVDTLGNLIYKNLGPRLKTLAVGALTRYARRAISEMYQEVKTIDSSLTQLQIVTGASETALRNYGNEAADTAQKVAASVSDIIDSTTVYARLGYTMNESLDFAGLTTMYSRVANVEASQATDNITSMVKAFNISSEELELALDKMVVTGNKFPISAAQLGEGLQNAGSALASAGNSFEQSLALLTAAVTTTQDISKSSTALRTISARIRGSKTELEELGEEMDSSYDTTAKYREKLLAITGVDILEADLETFKSTYDILKEISMVWKDINDIDRASVTEMIAGVRQQNVFASLMSNWNEASGVMAATEVADGAMSTANLEYIDSVAGRLNQLKATFQDFSQTVMSSDLLKGGIQSLTTVLKLLNDLFGSGFGKGVAAFVGIKTGLSLIQKLVESFTLADGSLSKFQKGFQATVNSVKQGGQNIAAAFSGVGKAASGSAAATGAASAALAGWASIAAIAIGATIAIVSAVQKKQQELRDEAISSAQEIDSQIAKDEDTIQTIKQLKEIVDDENSSYQEAYDARKQLLSIKDELIQAYGEEAEAIDLIGDSLDNVSQKIQNYQASKASEWLISNDRQIKAAQNYFNSTIRRSGRDNIIVQLPSFKYYTEEQKKITALLNKYTDGFEVSQNQNTRTYQLKGTLAERIELVRSLYKELENFEGEYAKNVKISLKETEAYLTGGLGYSEYEQILNSARENLVKSTNNTGVSDLRYDTYAEIHNIISAYEEEFKNAVASGDNDIAQEAWNSLIAQFSDIPIDQLDPLAQEFYNAWRESLEREHKKFIIGNAIDNGFALKDWAPKAFNEDGSFKYEEFQDQQSKGSLSGGFAVVEARAKEFELTAEELISILEDLGYVTERTADVEEDEAKTVGDLAEEYAKLNALAEKRLALEQEQRKIGVVSKASYEEAIALNSEYANMFTKIGDAYIFNAEKAKEYESALREIQNTEALFELAKQYEALEEAQKHIEEEVSVAKLFEQDPKRVAKFYEDQREEIEKNIDALERFIYMNADAAKAFDEFRAAQSTDDFEFSSSMTDAIGAIENGINTYRIGTDDFKQAMGLFFSQDIPVEKYKEVADALAEIKYLFGGSEDSAQGFLTWINDNGFIQDGQFSASMDSIKEALAGSLGVSGIEAAQISDSFVYPIIEQLESTLGEVDLSTFLTESQINDYLNYKDSDTTGLEKVTTKVTNCKDATVLAITAADSLEEMIDKFSPDLSGFDSIRNRLSGIYTLANSSREAIEKLSYSNIPSPSYSRYDGYDGDWTSTPMADGNAFAGGYKALIGEEAPELVVDRDAKRWTLVGRNGAEFVNLSKGDIVFSGAQTKALLKTGKIGSRGKTIGGKAFATSNLTFSAAVPNWWDGANPYGYSSATSAVADAASESFDNLIDWIEVRLDRLATKTERLVSSTIEYVGYSFKNAQLNKALDNIAVELEAQVKAINAYSSAMNSVGLSSYYQNLVKNGEYSFENVTDESLKEKIEEYQDLYEKAEACLDTITKLKEQQVELSQEKFDNVSTYYDNRVNMLQGQMSLIENQIGFLEESGELVSGKYYEKMASFAADQVKRLQEERTALQKSMDEDVKSGIIKVESDEWYEMLNTISEIDAQIIEVKTSVEEYNNKVNELKWDSFDRLNDRLSSVKNELDNIANLFSENAFDEAGSWTKEGISALSAYAQQAELSRHSVDEYSAAIASLEADYKKGKYSQLEYTEKMTELTEAQWESIFAYDEAKKAIVSLNEARITSVKEGMQKEIDAYSELINKKKETLSAEKDLNDFRDQINQKEQDVAKIERQLAAMANDSSASANAKRKQLQQELLEAQKDLEDTYYDHSIEKQQEALDKELSDFEESQNKKMEDLDEYLKDTQKVVSDSLELVLGNTESVIETYDVLMSEYGIKLSEYVVNPWNEGADAIASYGEAINEKTSAFVDAIHSIKVELDDMTLSSDTAAKSLLNTIEAQHNASTSAKPEPKPPVTTPAPAPSTSSGSTGNGRLEVGKTVTFSNGRYYSSSYGGVSGTAHLGGQVRIASIISNPASGQSYPILIQGLSAPYSLGWVSKSQLSGYAKGSKGIKSSQLALIDELGEELILRAGANGRLSYLTKGSGVVPADITKNLMEIGKYNVNDLIFKNSDVISSLLRHGYESNTTEFKFDSLLHVDNATTESIPLIEKRLREIIEEYNKKQNYALKKYTR